MVQRRRAGIAKCARRPHRDGSRRSAFRRVIRSALLLAAVPWGIAQVLEPEQADLARAGISAREKGDLPAAERALAELAKQVPWFLPVHLNLGLVRFERFDYLGAAQSFRDALALDQSVEGIHGLLGHALLETGRADEARETLQLALDRDPNDVKARFWLATALIQLGRKRAAAAEIEALRDSADGDPELMRLRILVSGSRSAELRRQIMRSAPDSAAAKITAGETLAAAKEWSEAAGAYEAVLGMEPHRRGVRLALGDLRLAQGDHDGAEALFREESTLMPYAAKPLLRLGDVLLLKGDSASAERILEKSLELASGNPEALELLARSRSDQGRYDAALKALLRATVEAIATPQKIRIEYQLSQVYRRLGDAEKANRHAAEFRKLQEDRLGRNAETAGEP